MMSLPLLIVPRKERDVIQNTPLAQRLWSVLGREGLLISFKEVHNTAYV